HGAIVAGVVSGAGVHGIFFPERPCFLNLSPEGYLGEPPLQGDFLSVSPRVCGAHRATRATRRRNRGYWRAFRTVYEAFCTACAEGWGLCVRAGRLCAVNSQPGRAATVLTQRNDYTNRSFR